MKTYLFDLNQFEYFHELIDLIVHFFASTQQLFKQVDARQFFSCFKVGELKLQFLVVVHHIHLAHEFLDGEQSFGPMLLDYSLSLAFLKLLIIISFLHLMQRRRQIIDFNFRIYLFIVILPSSKSLVLLIKWRF